jgi:membrane-bound acyltransferase YfiQ involved in biofilm formation
MDTFQPYTAIFGFIFYIWIGIQVSNYRNQIISFIDSLRWHWIILAVFVSYMFAISEAKILFDRSPDFLSSLRISNQVYSLAVFFALLKLKSPISPSWMDMRHETYGIYLIHWLILDLVKTFTARAGSLFYHVSRAEFADHGFLYITSPLFRSLFWIITFLIVYFSGWFITRMISKTNSSWLIGVNNRDKCR